jgi:hypothetical protein
MIRFFYLLLLLFFWTFFLLNWTDKVQATTDRPERSFYRLPELYNSNAVAGRLYLQPIGPKEDRIIDGFKLDVSLANAAEYRPDFNNAAESYTPMRYNTNLLSFRAAKGLNLIHHDFEIGGVFRLVQDNNHSLMADFLKWFHLQIGSDGHIPRDVPYGAVIGDAQTSVIGGDGKIYILSPDLYTKFQILKEQRESFLPNLAVKLSCRIPISKQPFDTLGIGASLGVSKEFMERFRYMAALALVYQNLYRDDFNASDLDVNQFAYDIFGGIGYDFGAEGGYYTNLGIRYSNQRVVYADNPDSATAATVVHGALNYISKNKNWEIFTSFGEEITAISRALEPDFIILMGVCFNFSQK